MTMTQRYAGMLRRHAGDWEKQAMPVQAECCRQAARHMEELKTKVDAAQSPWQPMATAPKDGTAVLILLDGSDMPHGARWVRPEHGRHAGSEGWYMTWDNYKLSDLDGPRYWMHCPTDPDAT